MATVRGVAAETQEALVSETVDQNSLHHQGFPCFLPCRAAAVAQDPNLRVRDHPPSPGCDRVRLAEAELRAAGPSHAGLAAQRGKGRTPSSRPGGYSASCAAARGAPASSPRPSTLCRPARQMPDEKGSLITGQTPLPTASRELNAGDPVPRADPALTVADQTGQISQSRPK